MLSLLTAFDVRRCAATSLRERRLGLSLRQADLAKMSGVGITTLRTFERTGQINFSGFAKLLTSLGLADRFIETLRQPVLEANTMKEFMDHRPARKRAPRKHGTQRA